MSCVAGLNKLLPRELAAHPENVYQTWNPIVEPREETVVVRSAREKCARAPPLTAACCAAVPHDVHAASDAPRRAARGRFAALCAGQGQRVVLWLLRHLWYVGGIACHPRAELLERLLGLPLLENGVRSAMDVAEALGASVPWEREAKRGSLLRRILIVLCAVLLLAVLARYTLPMLRARSTLPS